MLKHTTRNTCTCICIIRRTEHLWHKYFFTYWVLPKHVSQKPIYKNLHVAVGQKSTSWEDLQFYNRCGYRNFRKGGGLEEENFERKMLKNLLIHVSTRVHIKFRQTCNSFSLLPFQEDCLLFCFILLLSFIFKFERGLPPP